MLKVLEYALGRDIMAAQRRPRRPQAAFTQPPLVVLQGFGGEQHMKLTAVLFQNMFPAINVAKARLSECQVRPDIRGGDIVLAVFDAEMLRAVRAIVQRRHAVLQ